MSQTVLDTDVHSFKHLVLPVFSGRGVEKNSQILNPFDSKWLEFKKILPAHFLATGTVIALTPRYRRRRVLACARLRPPRHFKHFRQIRQIREIFNFKHKLSTKSNEKQGGRKVKKRMTITEVAQIIGISAKTIARWEKVGKVKRPKRDWRGWRVYDEGDLADIREFHETIFEG